MPRKKVDLAKEKQDRAFRIVVNRSLAEREIKSISKLAQRMPVTERTLYTRMNDPGSCRLSELRIMAKLLHFSPDDIGRFILEEGWYI